MVVVPLKIVQVFLSVLDVEVLVLRGVLFLLLVTGDDAYSVGAAYASSGVRLQFWCRSLELLVHPSL